MLSYVLFISLCIIVVHFFFPFQVNEILMTRSNKRRIYRHYDDLVDNMEVEDVLNNLISTDVLSPRNVDEIKQYRVRAERVEALLSIAVCKNDLAFYRLVEALQSTKQGHLARLLTREGKYGSLQVIRPT